MKEMEEYLDLRALQARQVLLLLLLLMMMMMMLLLLMMMMMMLLLLLMMMMMLLLLLLLLMMMMLLLLLPPPLPLFTPVLSLPYRPAKRCCKTRAHPTTSCAPLHPSQKRSRASWLGGAAETRQTLAPL